MTHATKDELERVGTLIDTARTALLPAVDEHGRLASRLMTVRERGLDAHSAELWTSPGPVVLLQYARAAVSGHPHVGGSRTVGLED